MPHPYTYIIHVYCANFFTLDSAPKAIESPIVLPRINCVGLCPLVLSYLLSSLSGSLVLEITKDGILRLGNVSIARREDLLKM